MASTTWPDPATGRAINDIQYEQLYATHTGNGLAGLPTDPAAVYADSSGRQIKFRSGKLGLLRGRMWSSGSADFSKSVAANALSSTRIDRAVLRLDRATWKVTEEIRQGTAGAGLPALVQQPDTAGAGTGIWEEPLARITVVPGALTLNPADVVPDPQFLGEPVFYCTSTTRPPHKFGRRIVETDTGKERRSDGANWYLVTDERNGLGEVGPYASTFVGSTYFERLDIIAATVPVIPGHFYNIHAFGTIWSSLSGVSGIVHLTMGSNLEATGDHPLPKGGNGHTASVHMLGWQAPAGSNTTTLRLQAGYLYGPAPANLGLWRVSVIHTGAGGATA